MIYLYLLCLKLFPMRAYFYVLFPKIPKEMKARKSLEAIALQKMKIIQINSNSLIFLFQIDIFKY